MSEIWPNFLIIGAGKSGTTSLDFYLEQHPEVFMSPVKEPNFYGYELHQETDFSSAPDELAYYQQSVTDKASYLQLFSEVESEKAVGEISNTYLYHKNACTRIKKYIPEAKLIAIFRQPAERLYSRYLHLARDNRLPTENFADCLDKSTIWWQRNDLVKEGFYYRHLSKFYDEFPKDQIKVFLYDDLKNDTAGLMREIFEFLGVDPGFSPDTSVKYNSSGFVKSKNYDKVFGYNGLIRQTAKKLVPGRIYQTLRRNPVAQKALTKVREKNLHKPKLSPELKREVTNIYREDIEKLSALVEKDLSHWLR